MRILHLVSAPTLTGPAAPALGIARGQRALGHEVAIGFDGRRPGTMAEHVQGSEVERLSGLALCATAPWTGLADRGRLSGDAARFDVVHAHASHDHAVAAAVRWRGLLVRSIHHPRGCRRRALQVALYRRAGGLTCPAAEHRAALLAAHPELDPGRVAVLPGAVDPERFHPGRDGRALRARYGFGPERVVVGVVARIKPGRGHRLFLEALAGARRRVPALAGALIGKGEGEGEIRAAIQALGLEGAVAMYGFRGEDLPEAIRSCDATALMEEGNDAGCRAVLESMSCGVPVIGADRPAIRAALAGGGGWIVCARDRFALERALVAAASATPAMRRDAGERGRARVLAEHTDRLRGARAVDLYRGWGARG